MTLRGDDRAVTVQVGTILLFGILIVSMSIYQSTAVPAQNQSVEYDHNQEVQSDMLDLRNAILRTGATGAVRPTTVRLGTRYPTRMVFVNPPTATGTLRTGPERTLSVSNATAVDAETANYWNGSTRTFSTRDLVYEPQYHEYDGAPATVYEHGLLYNRFDNGANLTLSDQSMIDGRRITLVTLAGDLSRSRTGPVSVDPRPLSPATTVRTVTVGSENNVTIRLPTHLSEANWTTALSGERVSNGGHVLDVESTGTDAVIIVLEPGNYDLRMAKVGLGPDATAEGAHYITDVSHETKGGTQVLVGEVRDRFDNPVSGVTVNATGAGGVTPMNATTDVEGRVRFTYEGSDPSATVTLAIGDAEREKVEFDVGTDGGGDGGGGAGGSGAFDVRWLDPSGEPGTSDCTADACTLNANEASSIDLTMDTAATADGAPVSFAVNDTSIATLSSATGTTDSNGEESVTLDAVDEGTAKVYTWSGGSGDVIEMTVRNFQRLAWDSAVDWDASADEGGVIHDYSPYADWPGDGTIKIGYPRTDSGGDNLVAYWPLDEDGGTTMHDLAATGTADDGTVHGATVDRTGIIGASAYEFDGEDDYVDLGTMDLSGDEMTISLWFKADDYDGDARLISKATSEANGDHWWMLSERGNKLRFRLKTSSGGTTELVASSGGLTTGIWTHAAVTYDGSKMRIYKNGQLVGSTAKSGTIATDSEIPVALGRNPNGYSPFDGEIDEVRVYDRALTGSEVQSHFSGGAPGSSVAHLTTAWKDAAGTNVTDLRLTNVDASVPSGTSATVYVESDLDGDGDYEQRSDAVSLTSGDSSYDVTGLTDDPDRLRLRIELDSDDPEKSPTVSGMELSY